TKVDKDLVLEFISERR
ncbi:MAG: hypothetical protein QXQ38_06470, partial [Archaeoglobaceae archaeon]